MSDDKFVDRSYWLMPAAGLRRERVREGIDVIVFDISRLLMFELQRRRGCGMWPVAIPTPPGSFGYPFRGHEDWHQPRNNLPTTLLLLSPLEDNYAATSK